MAWYTSPRVLRRLTLASTAAAGWYCVFHLEYQTDRPHVFSWPRAYYRREIVEPLARGAAWARAKYEGKGEP